MNHCQADMPCLSKLYQIAKTTAVSRFLNLCLYHPICPYFSCKNKVRNSTVNHSKSTRSKASAESVSHQKSVQHQPILKRVKCSKLLFFSGGLAVPGLANKNFLFAHHIYPYIPSFFQDDLLHFFLKVS